MKMEKEALVHMSEDWEGGMDVKHCMGPLHEHHSTGKLGQEVTAVIMFVPDQ
jgi:hypothetical protein